MKDFKLIFIDFFNHDELFNLNKKHNIKYKKK